MKLWLVDRSRMSREAHVRFCEGAGVRFPRATRLNDQDSSKVWIFSIGTT